MGLIKPIRGNLLVINFKTYIEATGKRAIELAKTAENVAIDTGATIVVAPQFTDIKSVSETVDIKVFSQHLDPARSGAHTGHVLAEAVKSAGAEGSILNHSERPIGRSEVEASVKICGETDLYSLVCADTADRGAEVAGVHPDMIAIEPPDLIGSGISVSNARPVLITDSITRIRELDSRVKILCGAGVTTSEDVSKALELGTEGVLVASSVVKSKDPGHVLAGMASALVNRK